MPTKKKRVGFIPRSNVLEIINKLSFESNLSTSKIINLLVEEALFKRGILNNNFTKANCLKNNTKSNIEANLMPTNNIKESINDLENNLLPKSNLINNEDNYNPLDSEIYEKFIMFLKFQEKMKKTKF